MAYLTLPAALARRGLTVETVPGWETRSNGYDLRARAAICHWTAGPRGTTRRASLNIVVNGRADLPGPLANVYLDRAGIAVVVSARSANHAGAGNWRGVSGNSSLFGTEAEAAGADDFTDAQRWAYPRVNAAYCDLGGFGPEMVAGHSEYATPRGRKTDINGYTMDEMRRQVAAVLNGTAQEDDVALDQKQVNWIADTLANRVIGKYPGGADLHLWEAWRDAALKSVDVNALAAAIVGKLPAQAAGGGLSKADVASAVREVFADASTAG